MKHRGMNVGLLPLPPLSHFSKHVTLFHKILSKAPVRKVLHVIDEETKAQRGEGTCPEQGKSEAIP